MDKQIPRQILQKRRRRRLLKLAGIGIGAITGMAILVKLLSAGVDSGNITVASVERGSLDISVTASGKIVPLSEEMVTSPVSSKILQVYKRSGEPVAAGEAILELDLVAANVDFQRARDELEMKHSKLQQHKVNVASQLADLRRQIEIDDMKLKRAQVQLNNEKYLDSIGASTADKVLQIELEYRVQQLQFEQLKESYVNQQQVTTADLRVLELEYNIARQNAELMQRTVGEASIRSPKNATLTWVNDQVGLTIGAGEQLAIISDLEHFKVEAEISDSYANRISSGADVIVEIGKERLAGRVYNVVPAVANSLLKFTVLLTDSDHERLRSGLKVDVFVISSVREEVLKIPNRSYYHGKGVYDLWVVDGEKAYKRKVELGESSHDEVEVIQGLKEGDRIIVNDMSRYRDNTSIRIRK